MNTWLRFVSIALITFGTALGTAARSRAQEEISCEGPLQGDELRYPSARVAERTWKDLAAIPASVVAWDSGDWARTAAFMVPTLTLMAPAQPSLDVRVQNWLKRHESRAADAAFIHIKTIPEAAALAAYGIALFSTAYFRKDEKLREFGTLSVEALAVEQFFHVMTKLMIGRESPYQGNGQGDIHGPTKFMFPGGTPSGHAATAYALLGVLASYWDKWPLYVLAQVGGLYISASLIYERQHFLSDVVWGAGMGWYIGRWIVRHRSSRYRCRNKKPLAWYQKVLWMPVVSGTQGFGLGASYRY